MHYVYMLIRNRSNIDVTQPISLIYTKPRATIKTSRIVVFDCAGREAHLATWVATDTVTTKTDNHDPPRKHHHLPPHSIRIRRIFLGGEGRRISYSQVSSWFRWSCYAFLWFIEQNNYWWDVCVLLLWRFRLRRREFENPCWTGYEWFHRNIIFISCV